MELARPAYVEVAERDIIGLFVLSFFLARHRRGGPGLRPLIVFATTPAYGGSGLWSGRFRGSVRCRGARPVPSLRTDDPKTIAQVFLTPETGKGESRPGPRRVEQRGRLRFLARDAPGAPGDRYGTSRPAIRQNVHPETVMAPPGRRSGKTCTGDASTFRTRVCSLRR